MTIRRAETHPNITRYQAIKRCPKCGCNLTKNEPVEDTVQMKNCLVCGKGFFPVFTRGKRWEEMKYCSRKCSNTAMKRAWRIRNESRT